ncbi:MAG TPA: prepilin-type N-terminal cleavage/methylation domain-containing protein [Thermoanaerobaculia bacterium]|nr:prepilin-type N-terminal cleavage/methylation domain-containing protein [Thermoanaerobaculia bacterium]
MKRAPARPSRPAAGFSLVELLVTLLVTSVLLLAVLATFDFNSRVSRVQTSVADMQQSLRVSQQEMVRWIRMAGRGGLRTAEPARGLFPPDGLALEVANNVAADTEIVPGNPLTRVVEGTDVVTVRGVFTSPLYQLNYTEPATLTLAGGGPSTPPTTGTIVVNDTAVRGVPQNLAALKEAIDRNVPEAILLVSPFDDLFAVVELVPAASSYDAGTVRLGFRTTGTRGALYGQLSAGGSYPIGLQSVNYLGILEEYRFYVREAHLTPGDETTQLMPKLARARMYPGTDEPWVDTDNATVDVADNILDLQVALGFDSANSGGATGTVMEAAGGTTDDWMLNRPGAAGITAELNEPAFRTNPTPPLYYLRLSTLARTERRDPKYLAPVIEAIEDHEYPATETGINSPEERAFRRRVLQTVIDLRNLG